MLRALFSVQKSVSDARTVMFVHAYRSINAVPSELHPNARLLDEALPAITVQRTELARQYDRMAVEAVSFDRGKLHNIKA